MPEPTNYLAQPAGSKIADALFLVLIAAVAGLLAYGHPEAALGVVIAFAYGTFFGNHAMQDALRKRGYAVAHIVATTRGRRGVVPSIGQTTIDGTEVRWFSPTFIVGAEEEAPRDRTYVDPAKFKTQDGKTLAEFLAMVDGGNP